MYVNENPGGMRGIGTANRRAGYNLVGSAVSIQMTSAPRLPSMFYVEHGDGSGKEWVEKMCSAVRGSIPLVRREGILHAMSDFQDAMRAHMQMERSRIALEEYAKNKKQIDGLKRS